MRVRLLTFRTGPQGSFPPGSEITVEDAEGLRMIAAGQAVAAVVRPETAAPPRRKREMR